MTTAAIHYHPDGYRTDRSTLMGRHAAGEGFLRGYLRTIEQAEYVCVAESQAHARGFADAVAALRPGAKARWRLPGDLRGLAQDGAFMLPGPDLAASAWRRRRGDQRGHSIIGVTHTTATHRAIDMIADTLIAPVQAWDALICTSKSVRSSVDRLLDERAAYLSDRIGANRIGRPQLPVIPLGVDADAMAAAGQHRKVWRDRLGIADADVAVLYFGRLSHHGKAHPSPMFAAVQQAVERIGAGAPKVHLILGGWYANDGQKAVFETEAKRLAPRVTLHHVDGRTAEAREGLWGGADIFTLLSDNIQETFGLAPVEGMAAGLPVVVSDWDGFRDTVEDGVEGFRIPSLFPAAGLGRDLAIAYEDGGESYDGYMAATSQFCAIDVPRAADAFARLIADPDLRARMGAAGQRTVRERFDWPVVIRQYQALWTELAAIRKAADERAPARPGAPAHPLRMDPTVLFSSYPTAVLEPADRLELSDAGRSALGATVLSSSEIAPRPGFLAGASEVETLFTLLKDGPLDARELVAKVEPPRRTLVFRTLIWMLKHDLLRKSGSQ